MTIAYDILFNDAGELKIRTWPTSTKPQREICRRNIVNGLRFDRTITASFNRQAADSHVRVHARHHGLASRFYPFNIDVFIDGLSVALITRYWTHTETHGGGFYWSREFYRSRNSRKRKPDQAREFSAYLRRNDDVIGYLVAGLEVPDRHVVFLPWSAVESVRREAVKIDLGIFAPWPSCPLRQDGIGYDIDIAEIAEMTEALAGGRDG